MASGNTLLTATARAFEPSVGGTSGRPNRRNGHPIVNLAVNEEVIFNLVLPRNYAGGGITVYHHFSLASATTGNVRIETSFERVGDAVQDVDADGFATGEHTGDVAVPATSGHVKIANKAHTDGAQIDSIAVGEKFRLRVKRIAAGASEATGDLEYHSLELKET